MSKREVTDMYALAQFSSLWAVVVHATEPDADRQAAYAEAWAAMAAEGRWGEYQMQHHTTKSGYRVHVGYRRANPKDWFMCPEAGTTEECDGPFRSKNQIKARLRVKTTSKRSAGIYDAISEEGAFVVFTRDRATEIFGEGAEERLP